MPFHYTRLSPAEAQAYLPRLKGAVLVPVEAAAIDAEAGVALLDLGGRPDVDPQRGEPPGHYNLFWGAEVVQAAGHIRLEQEDGVYIQYVDLSVRAPLAAEAKAEQLRALFTDAMAVLFSYGRGKPKNVHVSFSTIVFE